VNTIALTAADLRSIAHAVDRLSKSGVRVDAATVGQHRITLTWHNDQRDGSWYTVTSIERAQPR
jgi:hypothetical protein